MIPISEKAKSGNKKALIQLYEKYKANVYNISFLLSGSETIAENATIHSFSNALESVLKGIKTEEDFLFLAICKASEFCKKSILNKNNKAFRIPPNRNFLISEGEDSAESTDNTVLNVLNMLPSFQRFVLVLHKCCDFSSEQIAKALVTDRKTIELAFEAEEENIQKVLKQQNSSKTVEDFFRLTTAETSDFPSSINSAVDKKVSSFAKTTDKKKVIFTIASVLCIVAVIVAVGFALLPKFKFTSSTSGNGNQSGSDSENVLYEPPQKLLENHDYYANINIKNHGTVRIKLEPKYAPVTVSNFVNLAEKDFYNGLTFHRIMDGFMMQGGDPLGNGTGGADKDIVGEFKLNGHENPLSHKAGVVSMARATPYNSGSSQFFIVHKDSPHLDGQYAAFGYVVKGMDIVDKICTEAIPTDSNGTIPRPNQPIIESIEIECVEAGTDVSTDTSNDASNDSSNNTSEEVSTDTSEDTTNTSSTDTSNDASNDSSNNTSTDASNA